MAGFGDALIASGQARGAAARGKQIAFGDGQRILWSRQDEEIFRDNPNIARPGSERQPNIEWIANYKGSRPYAHVEGGRWRFHNFKCQPGEVYFSEQELTFSRALLIDNAVLIEPRVKPRGACVGINKQWPVARYQYIADELDDVGINVVQFVPPGERPLLQYVRSIWTPTFRHALAALSRMALYIGPEGGLHHGAAAVNVDAIVLFGGFNSPQSTGYDTHCNISIGEPCGTIGPCPHCRDVMQSITKSFILDTALNRLAQCSKLATTSNTKSPISISIGG